MALGFITDLFSTSCNVLHVKFKHINSVLLYELKDMSVLCLFVIGSCFSAYVGSDTIIHVPHDRIT